MVRWRALDTSASLGICRVAVGKAGEARGAQQPERCGRGSGASASLGSHGSEGPATIWRHHTNPPAGETTSGTHSRVPAHLDQPGHKRAVLYQRLPLAHVDGEVPDARRAGGRVARQQHHCTQRSRCRQQAQAPSADARWRLWRADPQPRRACGVTAPVLPYKPVPSNRQPVSAAAAACLCSRL